MSAIAEVFLEAVEAALLASDDLRDAMGLAKPRVYVERPTNAPKPYVLIGDDSNQPDAAGCVDGDEVLSTVDWYAADARQARRMGAAIVAALDLELEIVGHAVIVHELSGERYLTDPNGSTHGVADLRFETVPDVT